MPSLNEINAKNQVTTFAFHGIEGTKEIDAMESKEDGVLLAVAKEKEGKRRERKESEILDLIFSKGISCDAIRFIRESPFSLPFIFLKSYYEPLKMGDVTMDMLASDDKQSKRLIAWLKEKKNRHKDIMELLSLFVKLAAKDTRNGELYACIMFFPHPKSCNSHFQSSPYLQLAEETCSIIARKSCCRRTNHGNESL